MAKLIWTNQAKADLKNIAEYIAADSPKHARATAKRLYAVVQLLRKHPALGRMVPEKKQENIGEIFEGNYRIIYELNEQKHIVILTIHHAARRLNKDII